MSEADESKQKATSEILLCAMKGKTIPLLFVQILVNE